MRDLLSNNQLVFQPIQTLSGTTPNNSALFDTRGFDGLTVYLTTNTVTDAGDATGFTMKLQHSDTTAAASFVDVPADEFIGTNPQATLDTADNVLVGAVGYLGIKRYVRAVVTGSALTDAVVQVLGHLGKPSIAPVAAVGASVAAT
jgi:hypothetical protein